MFTYILKYHFGKEILVCLHEIWEFTDVSMAYSLKLHIHTFFPRRADCNHLHIFFPGKQRYQKLDFLLFLHCSFSNNLQTTGYGTLYKRIQMQ